MLLILIRGVSGSGKSTLARILAAEYNAIHAEADKYRMRDGVYVYDQRENGACHARCQLLTREALAHGRNAVVSNTFCTVAELAPYFAMAKDYGVSVQCVDVFGPWRDVHNVPDAALDRQRKAWQSVTPDAFNNLTKEG